MPLSETLQRLLVAAVGIPITLAAVLAGGWWLAALILLVSVLAALELFRMVDRKPARALRLLGSALAGSLVIAAALAPAAGPQGSATAPVIASGLLLASAVAIWSRGVDGEPLMSAAATVFGAMYTGGLLSYGLFLRHLPGTAGAWHGAALVLAPVLLTWVSDTSAYFVGRAWGSRKLIPGVSPGKTVEGAVGALAGAVVAALAFKLVLAGFPTYRIGWTEAVLFGLLVSVAAQIGDLVESLFKRDAGVKDSGTLLPGHGGALDRVDSLLFTLPLAYLFFRFVVGA